MVFHASLLGAAGVGIISLMLLMLAAEKAVKKIHILALHYGFSTTFAGLTVFSITTSIPEIFAHLAASISILAGTLDYRIVSATVLGANIGSDVVQQTFVLGLVVLLMGELVLRRNFLFTAYLPMIATHILCIILGYDWTYSRLDGLILLGSFIGYMVFLYSREDSHTQIVDGKKQDINPMIEIFRSGAYMIIMLISAHFLLASTELIVRYTGIGSSLIGVLSLGVASAAPEFFTAISGIRQKAVGISLGTLIGSNITNPLFAIGGGALLSTYWVPRPLIYWDLSMEAVTATMLLAYLVFTKGNLGKKGAWYLIFLYFFYLAVRVYYFSVD